MRKISVVLFTMALVFGMTQCKKKIDTVTPTGNGNENKIHITLDVENGGRHDVNTSTGAVTFDDGDVIYVGDGNKYIGSLTRKNGEFLGDIDIPTGEDLHFYFVGGLEPSTTPTASSTTSFDVDISDQSVKLPTISHASVEYISGTTEYSCTMLNKCGLVKFNLTNTDIPASQEVGITGMNNSVKVQFDNTEPFDFDKVGDGIVILNAASNQERWAIIPVQNAVNNATAYADGYVNSTAFAVPAVTANMYYTDGVSVPAMEWFPYIDASFSVDENGKTVKFALGNLQYNKVTGKYSFMAHQYNTVETDGQDVGDDYADQSIVSLFGWGTGNAPTNTSDEDDDYTTFNDWGHYCGDPTGSSYIWRTLTFDEWVYVIDNSARGSYRYLKANITVGSDNYNGVILFPDNYAGTVGSYVYNNTEGWTTVSESDWMAMELAGAVFLPIAGDRLGTSVRSVESDGYYWTSDADPDGGDAYLLNFYDNEVCLDCMENRYKGMSVRLVRDVE